MLNNLKKRKELTCIAAGILYLLALTWILFNGFRSRMGYGTWSQYVNTHTNFVPLSTSPI